jgi:hypothetical protein
MPETRTCGCCGGTLPPDKDHPRDWVKGGECPGSVRSKDGFCGSVTDQGVRRAKKLLASPH